jgi:hypothetical protein
MLPGSLVAAQKGLPCTVMVVVTSSWQQRIGIRLTNMGVWTWRVLLSPGPGRVRGCRSGDPPAGSGEACAGARTGGRLPIVAGHDRGGERVPRTCSVSIIAGIRRTDSSLDVGDAAGRRGDACNRHVMCFPVASDACPSEPRGIASSQWRPLMGSWQLPIIGGRNVATLKQTAGRWITEDDGYKGRHWACSF